MKVLVVEDDAKLAAFIRRALREDGHVVDLSRDGVDGAHFAMNGDYDVIILDLELPRGQGLSLVRQLRGRKQETALILLGAEGRPREGSAEEPLAKPFTLEELRARVRALLARGGDSTADRLQHSDLAMNLKDHRVHRGGRELSLTRKEFALLEFFLRNPRRVLTRTSIEEHVWNHPFESRSNVVEVFVNLLRKKTEEGGEPRLIQAVRGVGYVLLESGGTLEDPKPSPEPRGGGRRVPAGPPGWEGAGS